MNTISIATHEEVQKHPANTSPSKVSFRFSKSKRFRDNNPQCPIAFYSYRSQLSRRRASIGNSRRTDFTLDLAHVPSSALYDFNTYYQFIKNKGLSFRLSREVSPDQSYLIPQIQRHPGVGEVILLLLSMSIKNLQRLPLLTQLELRLQTQSKDI